MPQSERPDCFDPRELRVFPLAQRRSLCRVEDILVKPEAPPAPCPTAVQPVIRDCARQVLAARRQQASVILLYGAHLLRNGAALILEQLLARGWLTHLATNGAGSIHDWEYAFQGQSTESVRENVATGTFGAWDETGRMIHVALLSGALRQEGYGGALGRFIEDEGTWLPTAAALEAGLRRQPDHPDAPAWAELLQVLRTHGLAAGPWRVPHPWKATSILGLCRRHGVPATVHPGIGYDIISNHPLFNGAAIGRAAGVDFRKLVTAVGHLTGGVVLSVGSAIMAPQVFEKSLSCINNLRLQRGLPIIRDHRIYVVDLQEGGGWDWTRGEPPKTNPAYYLRFCKSYARMGGAMQYACCDNVTFIHHLYRELLEQAEPSRPSPSPHE